MNLRTGPVALAFAGSGGFAHRPRTNSYSARPRRPAISVSAMRVHLRRFQDIADRNGGNRAAGTSGYAESAAYAPRCVRTGPGIEDNGSGSAALLEIARGRGDGFCVP